MEMLKLTKCINIYIYSIYKSICTYVYMWMHAYTYTYIYIGCACVYFLYICKYYMYVYIFINILGANYISSTNRVNFLLAINCYDGRTNAGPTLVLIRNTLNRSSNNIGYHCRCHWW